jgi:hypothetical protein
MAVQLSFNCSCDSSPWRTQNVKLNIFKAYRASGKIAQLILLAGGEYRRTIDEEAV